MRWSAGETTVERLIAAGHIERVRGAQADGASWLDRARRGLEAAQVLAESAPDSSVILAMTRQGRPAPHHRRRSLRHRGSHPSSVRPRSAGLRRTPPQAE